MGDEWQAALLGELCFIQARLVDPTLPEYQNLPHVGIERIETRTGRLMPLATAAKDGVTSAKYLFTAEDVLYSKIRPELRKAAFPRFAGLASADAYPLSLREQCLPGFLHLLLLSPAFGEASIAKSGRTKMPKINRGELFSIEVTLPPLGVQRRIVDLIGALDGQVEALDSEWRSASALLSAMQRQLIGDPEGARTTLGSVATIVMGQSPPGEATNRTGEGTPLLNGPTEFGPIHPTPAQWTSLETKRCLPGDVLFCVRGATAGRMNRADQTYCLGRGLAGLRGTSPDETNLIFHLVQAGLPQLLPTAGGTIFPNVSGQMLRELEVSWPEDPSMLAALAHRLDAMSRTVLLLGEERASLRSLRGSLAAALLNRDLEVPGSYDALLTEAK